MDTLEEAQGVVADPNASELDLQTVAGNFPELLVPVALHPKTYPGLLQWLEEQHVPLVDQALRERQLNGPKMLVFPQDIGKSSPWANSQKPGEAPESAESVSDQSLQRKSIFTKTVTPPTVLEDPTQVVSPKEATELLHTPAPPANVEPPVMPVAPSMPATPAASNLSAPPAYSGTAIPSFSSPSPYPANVPGQTYSPAPVYPAYGVPVAQKPKKPVLLIVLLIVLLLSLIVVAGTGLFILQGNSSATATSPTVSAENTEPDPAVGDEESAQPEQTSPSEEPKADEEETPEASPAPAGAHEWSDFSTTSGNTTCRLSSETIVCEIKNHEASFQDCPVDQAVRITQRGKDLSVSCLPKDAYSSSPQVPAYEESVTKDKVACTSRQNGTSCWNKITGQGFRLNRQGYFPTSN